ncbi:MAG: Smr/MutS family protein [bacterium]
MRNPDKSLHRLEFDRVIEAICGRCRTAAGQERVRETAPGRTVEWVRAELARTTQMRGFIEERRPGWDPGAAQDIPPALRKLQGGRTLEPEELLSFARLLELGESVRKTHVDEALYPTVAAFKSIFFVDPPFRRAILRAVDETGGLRDDASPELQRIRSKIRRLEREVPRRLKRWMEIESHDEFLQSKLVTIRNGRFVVPVRVEFLSRSSWILQDRSGSGATAYVEPLEVLQENNELANLRIQEKREIYRLLRHYTDELFARLVDLEASVDALGRLDALMAKAEWCAQVDAVAPEIAGGDAIEIVGGRHPLLGDSVVPVDVEAGGDVRALVITGPNAGGKTVCMKTVGLFQCLAQAGLQVPAEAGTRLPVFKRIITVLGDEQSIERNLSSFASHLTELREAVEESGEGALVLIDEICSGTDPEEGSALACGVVEWLIGCGAVSVVTSHMSRLKAFAAATPGALNASMRFDEGAGRPIFTLNAGTPGKSYALEIAGRLGLPRKLIDAAVKLLGEGKRMTEKLLSDLEALRSVLSAEKTAIEKEKEKVGRDRAVAEKQRREVEEGRRRLVADACEEANELLEETRKKCEDIFRRAHEAATLPQRASVKGEIKEEKKKVSEVEKKQLPPARPLRPGELKPDMWVRLIDTGEMGQYDSGPDRRGNVRLIIGGLPMVVSLDNVALPDRPAPAEKHKRRDHERFIRAAMEESTGEIDLHGLRVKEALEVLEKKIETLHLAGADRLRVVHGIGTGALMKAVQEYLGEHVLVKRFEPGMVTEGGIGVTVAYLSD